MTEKDAVLITETGEVYQAQAPKVPLYSVTGWRENGNRSADEQS